MVSGKAPDLVEIGLGLPAPIWLSYLNRYFVPLSDLANQPNPFNAGTDLEGVPLKNTYGDSMRSGYTEELQEYMRVPLSRFTMRVFYNRTLLRELTGLEAPPNDWQGFVQVCRSIEETRDASGRPVFKTNSQGQRVFAIAGSKYHTPMWEYAFANITSWTMFKVADFNRDGNVGNDEQFAAFKAGLASFKTRPIRAKFEMVGELLRHFQTGFAGLSRVEAVMLFAKQQAVFMPTGTWDAGSLIEQSEVAGFELGLMNFPLPTSNDPDYGSIMFGPAYDPSNAGFPFGVTRFSKHPDIAKDFLLFLSSKSTNERLNKIIGWIPAIDGAAVPDMLRGFEPSNQGMWSNINFDLGGETVIKYAQLFSLFQTDPSYTLEEFIADFEPFYLTNGMKDWNEQQRDWRRGIINNEKFLSALRGEALLNDSQDLTRPSWIKYRSYTASRQVFPEINFARQRKLVNTGPIRPVGPYDYLPSALDNVRKSLAGKGGR
jgi:raffinose/stachyose/melibiose transport system substrate-binding protein